MSSDETIQGALSDLQDLQATLEEQQYLESMYNLLTNDMSEDLANFMKKIMRSGGELSENEVLSMTKDEIAKYMVGSSRVSLLPVSGRLPESILKSSTPVRGVSRIWRNPLTHSFWKCKSTAPQFTRRLHLRKPSNTHTVSLWIGTLPIRLIA